MNRTVLRVACILAIGIGPSLHAQDLPRVFITSARGTGNLSTWPLANGLTGLNAADRICQNSANAAQIPNSSQYIAWISSTQDDAYCRVHGLHGQRVNSCNTSAQLGDAGPWYRMDGLPAIDIARNSMIGYPGAGYVPRHIEYDEFGSPFIADDNLSSVYFSSTLPQGILRNASETCADWTSEDQAAQVQLGQAYRGYGGWSGDAFGWSCNQYLHLACLQSGSHGPAFTKPHVPNARRVFVTSSAGIGDLSSWPDAGGATSINAGNAICRAHANRAHLPLPDTYRAWLSSSTNNAISTFAFDGPWYRTDGVRIAASIADLGKGTLEAPLQIDESSNPVYFENPWTGTNRFGTLGPNTCSDWQSSSSTEGGSTGQTFAADYFWTSAFGTACSQPSNLYCFADNDSLFLDNFDN